MKEFMLLFRADYKKMQNSSPEDWQAMAKKWNNWKDGIIAQGKWGAPGQRLGPDGKVIKTDGVITDGPYTETKEILLSYCTVKTETIEDAAELSKGCPILSVGGNVEIRELVVS